MREKINFYECVMQCDISYIGREHRRENLVNIYEAQHKDHVKRLYPADPYKRRPADILGLRNGRELERSFVESFEKEVSRPQIDERGVPKTYKRELKPKLTKIKFVKLDPDEITDSIRARVIILPMREMDLKPTNINEGTDTTQPQKPRTYRKKRKTVNAKKVGAETKGAS